MRCQVVRVALGLCVCGWLGGVGPSLARGDGAPPTVKEALTGAVATTHRPDLTTLKALRPQWAVSAEASSEYGPSDWSASQLTGEPNVYPAHGDLPQAWATRESDNGHAWVIARFGPPRRAQAVAIMETYNVGAVVRLDDVTDPKRPVTLWSGETRRGGTKGRVTVIAWPAPREVGALRVVLDSGAVLGWNELDAVALFTDVPDLGPDELSYNVKPFAACVQGATASTSAPLAADLKRSAHWAQQLVEVSGERGSPGFGGVQALAAPDTYPDAGELDRAWSPDAADEGGASITVRFHPTTTDRVLIVTNANGAAVAQVDDLTDPSKPTTLWYGERDTRTEGAQVLTLTLPAARRIQTLRVSLDTRRTPGWEAIDAIGLGL